MASLLNPLSICDFSERNTDFQENQISSSLDCKSPCSKLIVFYCTKKSILYFEDTFLTLDVIAEHDDLSEVKTVETKVVNQE